MKYYHILLLIIFLGMADKIIAQSFLQSGIIEYEVKTNVFKQNENNPNIQFIKTKYPKFTNKVYTLAFDANRSLYKFSRNAENIEMYNFIRGMDENIWYNDNTEKKFSRISNYDEYFTLSGSQRQTKWKLLLNQRREIAGYECKLAQTILFDSVFVFAYYTDQIKMSGGPMNLGGLPGMILGITIPRLHTSWIATKVSPIGTAASGIVPPIKGKKVDEGYLKTVLTNLFKSNTSENFLQQLLWWTFL